MYIGEGVPYVHRGGGTLCTWRLTSPPPGTFDCAPKNGVPPKIAQKGRFLAQISVSDQNSKELLKNLKYFLGYGPIFEKKVCKKRVKKGSK